MVRKDGSFFEYNYFSPLTDASQPLDDATNEWPTAEPIENDPINRMEGHSLFALKSITYPEGATVSYQYNLGSTCFYSYEVGIPGSSSNCAPKEFLKERSITGEIIPGDMAWTFRLQQHFDQTPKMLRSVIDGPAVNGRRTRQLFEYALSEANTDPKLASAHSGKLLRHHVIDIPEDAHTTGQTGISIKKTDYVWGFHAGVVDFSRLPRTWSWREKLAWQHLHKSRGRRLQEKTITVDDNTFKTVYAGFNMYGHATRHGQFHGSVGRTVALEYLNQKAPWIVGKVSKKTIEKVDGSNDFMPLERTFFNSGQTRGERANGLYSSYTYHADGELHTVKNGDNIQTGAFTSYTLGIPKKLTRASSNGAVQKNVALNGAGKVTSESHWGSLSIKTTFGYDANNGKLNAIQPPTLHKTVIRSPVWHNANRADYRRKTSTIGTSHRTRTYYDTLGRALITFEEDSANGDKAFTFFRYDANGRLSYQSLPYSNNLDIAQYYNGQTITPPGFRFTYDALGRITQKTHTVDGSKTRYCYSNPTCQLAGMLNHKLGFGRVSKDAEGYFTVVNYRAFGRPSSQHAIEIHQQIKGASYAVTKINRDLINRIKSVTQGGKTRRYTYKPGTLLLASETHPETGKTQYITYDNRGNLKKKKTADGAITLYSYTDNDLILTINHPAGTDDVSFTYTHDDKIESIISGSVTRQFAYRDDGLLETETLEVDGEAMTLTYKYDKYGFVNQTRYPSGQWVRQSNNTFGWVRSIAGVVSNIHYHSNGVMTQAVMANGQKFTATLDNKDRVSKWKTLAQNGNNKALSLQYHYDIRNNIGTLANNLNTHDTISMAYDGLSRLTQADSAGLWGAGTITYGSGGDITQLKLGSEQLDYHYAHTYQPSGQSNLLRRVSASSGAINSYLFEYDRNGNVIDNGKRSFIYDKANRMTHADAGGRIYDFIYDGDGRRVRSIRQDTNDNNAPIASTKVTQYFFYNSAGKLMYEKNKNTGIRKDHIYANGRAIAERHYYNETVDTDNDGIPNHYEELYGLQADNADDVYSDSDNDGISNYQEFILGSNPNSVDTDNDGVNDHIEADYAMDILEDDSALDLDGDGVSNYNEIIAGSNPADTLVQQRMLAIVPILKILLAPNAQ